MARDEDESLKTPAKAPTHQVGQPLDAISVDEIDERVRVLHDEIRRLEEDKRAKLASRNAASAVFKLGS
ncbi:MAG: hypothetical protein NVS2B5_17700 [Beijerinckiaceae bacterium]